MLAQRGRVAAGRGARLPNRLELRVCLVVLHVLHELLRLRHRARLGRGVREEAEGAHERGGGRVPSGGNQLLSNSQ